MTGFAEISFKGTRKEYYAYTSLSKPTAVKTSER